jgi:hypothetical protein
MSSFDEVESGVRLAFIILAVVVTLILLMAGLDIVFLESPEFLVRGSVILSIPAAVIVLTIRWWAPWFFAVCGISALRSLAVGIFAPAQALAASRDQVPRSLFFEMALILGLMAVFSFRFVDQKPNWLDSICLVGALVGVCFSLMSPEHVKWMLIGVSSLGVAFSYEYVRRKMAVALAFRDVTDGRPRL